MGIPELAEARILITGGAGFIGSHLADAAVAAGARVRILDNLATGLESNLDHLQGRIEWQRGDLRDLEACRRAVDQTTFVFHQGALGSVPRSLEDPATSIAVNVGGTTNLFMACRDAGVRRIVYASSSSVYGDHPGLPKEEGREGNPLSPYALSKSMCEQLCESFTRSFGLEIVGLRYFNVYGPRQRPDGPYAAVIPRFFDAYREGRAPKIFGDGEQSRDFTFVADAVHANLLAAGAPAESCGRAYNVAAGRRTTLNELVREIRSLMGGTAEAVHEPERAGDVRHSLADLRQVEAGIGYRPRFDLAEGLRITAESYGRDSAGRS